MIIHFLKTAPAALSLLALFFWAGCAPEDPPPEKKADPNPVTSFVATPYDARVVLGWTNPTDAGFAGVLIMRRSDGTYPASTQDGTLVYDGSSQTYQDTTVTNDTTYHYAAFAYYDSSVYSAAAQASATPSAGLVYSPGNLKITEVGSAYYSNSSNWIEIYNASAEPAQLASYSLRTLWGWWDGYTFDSAEAAIALPTATVPAGGYMLVRGAPPDTPTQNTAQVVYVSDGQGRVPYWDSDGYAELILDGATADFVRFGSSGSAPTTASAWGAGAAPALPNHDLSYGYSIARDGSNTDSDVAGDWYSRDFATPGGPNDVTCLLDEDQDGIPDCSEEPGSTFAGLPLYDWGARTGQRDVFIHLNYMQSTDEGLIPRRESLAKINSAFASRGI
ncbi:MAG: lamin tail domain-containing protein, partial [Deltaproteobacteria bacterium]|nr:lamin tail domain-containing protein [Deltaproteobacteria bacterium]